MKSTSNLLDKIPNVILDPNGVFKYIQIFVRDKSTNESKNVVRGYQKFKFHADNYEFFTSILIDLKLASQYFRTDESYRY